MKFTRTGVILCTENYQSCVDFYSGALELPVMFTLDNEHSKLTCCDMGSGNYLMIEEGCKAVDDKKPHDQNPVRLRFNVENVEAAVNHLESKNVEVRVRKEVWGTVGDFIDPDGNGCSLRDEATFAQ